MSHLVTITTQVRDPVAVTAACRRLSLPAPTLGTFRLYASEATGLGVQLPGWRYPVVCETDSGRLHYDHFQGRWGAESELHRFLQRYAAEKTRLEAQKAGQTVTEETLPNGAIRLQLTAH